MNRAILIALVLALLPLGAFAKRKSEDVDFVELATLLVRDGNYERAQNVLAQVDLEGADVDLARFHLVRGLVRLNRSLYRQAAEDFELAIEEARAQHEADPDETEAPDPILYVYLGQALFHAEAWAEAIEALERAGKRAEDVKSTFAMRAEANWKLERFEAAWDALDQGLHLYPEYHELLRRKVFYAVHRGLYEVAAGLGRAYLTRADVGPEDYLAIGTALYRSGSLDEALEFLELARLRFPGNLAVITELARVYQEQRRYRTAAMLLERASLLGSDDVAVEAAELYRKSGELYRALALNARVADSAKRLRQRLALLLELRRFEMVALMDRDLKRVGLLDEEGIRYALAYAFFKTGRFDRAEALLSGLSDPELFRQATELRKAMEDCRADPWRC